MNHFYRYPSFVYSLNDLLVLVVVAEKCLVPITSGWGIPFILEARPTMASACAWAIHAHEAPQG